MGGFRVSVESIPRLLFGRRPSTHPLHNVGKAWKPTWQVKKPNASRLQTVCRRTRQAPRRPSRLWQNNNTRAAVPVQRHRNTSSQEQTKTVRFPSADVDHLQGVIGPRGRLSLTPIKTSERCRDTSEQEASRPGNFICYKSIIAFGEAQQGVLRHICIASDLK